MIGRPIHPPLELAGLGAAAEDGLRGAGITLDYTVEGVPRPLDPEVEAVVIRVEQEAIANVVKHSAAHTVRLGLSYGARAMRLSVNDDGRGFAVDPDFHAYGGHWGLLGMRERASQIRAKLSVRSAPGHGSEIVIRVPYAISGGSTPRRRSLPKVLQTSAPVPKTAVISTALTWEWQRG